jgi:hypothetical protein
MAQPNNVTVIKNPLPRKNPQGVAYPNWHAKHPANGVVVPAVAAPTIQRGQ